MRQGYVLVSGDDITCDQPAINEYLLYANGQVCRYDGSRIQLAAEHDIKLKPRNPQQIAAFDLLNNDAIPIKALVGIAGSGKTKLATAHGLYKVQQGVYRKVFVVRNPVSVGESMGFNKGTFRDKINRWIKPVLDNLRVGGPTIEQLEQRDQVEFDVPDDMQGRDLKDAFIIVDEAQMLTTDQVKMLGSRVSEGATIVFCGDCDQTFNSRFKGDRNGLLKMLDVFYGLPEFGMVKLAKCERSRVAELFATLL